MTDTYADGTRALFSVRRPAGAGWIEVPGAQRYSMGYPAIAFFHEVHSLFVISAVEVASDEDKGPEYHISISKRIGRTTQRCTSHEAKWVLDQFQLDGAEEDNHVPSGLVRNFWRPLATGLIGMECRCKEDEPAIVEDKGDYVWRGVPGK
jgi:hypothetical protein